VSFWCGSSRTHTRAALRAQGIDVVELDQDASFPEQDWRSRIVVVDGYHFDEAFWQRLQASKPVRTVHIDDLRPVRYLADMVVCYNEGLVPGQFQLAPTSRLFLGGRYLLLRKEILRAAETARGRHSRRSIVLAAGGTRQHAWLARMLARLAPLQRKAPYLKLRVLAGRRQPVGKVLSKAGLTRGRVRFASGLDAQAMVRLYRQAYCIVTPASTLMLEAFSVGCPIVSGWVADNQRVSIDHYQRTGLIQSVGDLRSVSREELLHALRRAVRKGSGMRRDQRAYIAAARSGLSELCQAILHPAEDRLSA
jgi:spore coat polysaccharide biosynthesis predicted glycosyltransferase SpsG